MQPGLYLPTVLRAWRLFFVYHVSNLKQHIAANHLKRRESGNSEDAVSDTEIREQNGEGEFELSSVVSYTSGESLNDREATVEVIQNNADAIQQYQRSERLLHSLNIMVSTPFILGAFTAVFVLFVVVWIGLNMMDPSLYFSLTRGCRLSFTRFMISAIVILSFLIIDFAVGVLLFTVRDTWYMR